MIHILMVLLAWMSAIGLRWRWQKQSGNWADRWQRALGAFLLPPLLLMSTALSLLWMGPMGQMVMGWQGWLTYGWAIVYLLVLGFLGLQLSTEAYRIALQLQQYPQRDLGVLSIDGQPQQGRWIDSQLPFIAQVGLWQPQLIFSQGLVETLDQSHLSAVLRHEEAHRHYGDTLWFFYLGWLRRCSFWLPQTEALWQELLLLREMRADRYAATQVDPLLLAEALFTVVSAPIESALGLKISAELGAALSDEAIVDRLSERIDQLLDLPAIDQSTNRNWFWIIPVLMPMLAIPFHHAL
jgi:Zn-dependent protease with chaperone function